MSRILVVLEQQGDSWHRLSWEALAAGQQMAADLSWPVSAAVLGNAASERASKATKWKLDSVYAVEHSLLSTYTADGFTAALEGLIRKIQPSLVLFPHTYQARDYAPKLATRFGRVLVSDIIQHAVVDGVPVFVRQLFQGKLSADIRCTGPAPYFVSVQAGAYRSDSLEAGFAQVETFIPELDDAVIRVTPLEPFRESAGAVDLSNAEVIVSVGRGIKEKEHLQIIEKLAEALGAELGASRPICDNGWLPMERQVGSSGQTVSPKLYVAIGISGAIQHLVGMKGSKTIVAVNKDPEAPIFEVADYGIVGDLFEVVPALTEEIRKAKGSG
ncbi:MAG TPA: electron transfer flavoprotein subunit alpha/FixB family protein [Bryobacteraceae bacterium]|nr:electron transfer flavoprotein subunit alpha/FixB family protein [Bryobacteraceae bacterium]